MIVLINMGMPTSCYGCDFAYQDQDSEHNIYWTCAVVHKSACMLKRRDDCPLIPVPGYERLIDVNALEVVVEEHYKHHKISRYDRDLLLHYLDIEMSPTIVPAESLKEEET